MARAKAAPEDAGDSWKWTALDADSKLIVSWLVGGRDGEYALAFMDGCYCEVMISRAYGSKALHL